MADEDNKPVRRASRIGPFDLPISTKEQHEAAVEAMRPFLIELQQAANEQTAMDFRPHDQLATCTIDTPDGSRITFQISDMVSQPNGKVLLTLVSKPQIGSK